MPPSLATTYTT
jgi:hypothetical protein